jgi:hypothetical protein
MHNVRRRDSLPPTGLVMPTTRRIFCSRAATLLLAPRLLLSQGRSTARLDVAAIDRERILQAADKALAQPVTPISSIAAPRSPGTAHDFYSEAEDYWPDSAAADGPYVARTGAFNPEAFTAHRDAVLDLSVHVTALVAAFVLTGDGRYAAKAAGHLKAWFVDSATSMTPSLVYAQVIRPAKTGRFEGILEAVPLAEVAQSLLFLGNSEAFTAEEFAASQQWFNRYFEWLTTSRLAGLARDHKSHHGSSWLLQAAAIAHLNQADDKPLTALRHQYKSVTIRAQIVADGVFPHELTTSNPYRNSLFNLDMLAGVCVLLSTRFESVWDYDLQDGPGMRSVMARHYPFILNRGAWPYRADATHFMDLPLRRPSLLFAARAYDRPEYAELWRSLPADTTIPELQRSFPIRQPLLWVTRPKP